MARNQRPEVRGKRQEGRGRGLIAALLLVVLFLLSGLPHPMGAQALADCGVVDSIHFPVEDMADGTDDFGIFRAQFGGRHTGVDVAFYRYGDPVHAAARGRVTYSNTEGWDTEKGVVIVEHTFPNGEIFYTLYGHMEQVYDYFFPAEGQCVTPDSIVGAVGSPSLSAPHLHFEVRNFLPDDGGPGYWDTNPLEAGWLHPLDFVYLWQMRLNNGSGGPVTEPEESPYVSHVTPFRTSSVPPLVTSDGGLITAEDATMDGIDAAGRLRWRLELSGRVMGMIGLPGDRVLARTADDTVLILNSGRYEAQWRPGQELTGGPLPLGDNVAFFTEDNALVTYTFEGIPLWATIPLGDRVSNVALAADRIAVGTRPRDYDPSPTWRVLDSAGAMLYQVAPANPPVAAFGLQDDYALIDGGTLYHVTADFTPTPLATLPDPVGRNAALITDRAGNTYVYSGWSDGALLAFDAAGELRWQVELPEAPHLQAPLLAVGESCLLYALAGDGTLYAFNTTDGALLGQAALYDGGMNGHPAARVLDVLPGEYVRFGAGFLTVATLSGYTLAGIAPGSCS